MMKAFFLWSFHGLDKLETGNLFTRELVRSCQNWFLDLRACERLD
jgi:hypothetical protein